MSKYGNRYKWPDSLREKLRREYGPYGFAPRFAKETGISLHSVYKMANYYNLKQVPKHRYFDKNTGYIKIYLKDENRKTYEHIYVYEKATGKKLTKGYVIHHLNGIKTDNRIENLIMLTRKQHILIHKGLLTL